MIVGTNKEQMTLQDFSRLKCERLQTQLATIMVDMVIWMQNIAAVGQALDDPETRKNYLEVVAANAVAEALKQWETA